jgi:hypothetical protein
MTDDSLDICSFDDDAFGVAALVGVDALVGVAALVFVVEVEALVGVASLFVDFSFCCILIGVIDFLNVAFLELAASSNDSSKLFVIFTGGIFVCVVVVVKVKYVGFPIKMYINKF